MDNRDASIRAVSDSALPDPVASLIRTSITSIWALELLLFLKARDSEAVSIEVMVRELRGSGPMIADLLIALHRAGLLEAVGETYRYNPNDDKLRRTVDELERLSLSKPFAVRNAILAAPHDKVQVFADAFRIKRN
jgi:hypothetical protein